MIPLFILKSSNSLGRHLRPFIIWINLPIQFFFLPHLPLAKYLLLLPHQSTHTSSSIKHVLNTFIFLVIMLVSLQCLVSSPILLLKCHTYFEVQINWYFLQKTVLGTLNCDWQFHTSHPLLHFLNPISFMLTTFCFSLVSLAFPGRQWALWGQGQYFFLPTQYIA